MKERFISIISVAIIAIVTSGCSMPRNTLAKHQHYYKYFPITIGTSSSLREGSTYIVSEGETVSLNISETGEDDGGKFMYANICLDDTIIHRVNILPSDYQFVIKDLSIGQHILSIKIHIIQFGTEKQLNPTVQLLVK